jgi:hypothetical protein
MPALAEEPHRELAVSQAFGAHRAALNKNFELAGRMLDDAESELGSSQRPVFASLYLRHFVRERLTVWGY